MGGNTTDYINVSQHALGSAEVNHGSRQDDCFSGPEYVQVDMLN
jgi:hypothetical protein